MSLLVRNRRRFRYMQVARGRVKEAFERLGAHSGKFRRNFLRNNQSFPLRTHVYDPAACHHTKQLCDTCLQNPDHCRRDSIWHPSMTLPKGLVPPVELFMHVRAPLQHPTSTSETPHVCNISIV